jgi:hypothetical protein
MKEPHLRLGNSIWLILFAIPYAGCGNDSKSPTPSPRNDFSNTVLASRVRRRG